MHSDEMEDIQDSGSGDIVALFGIECNTGDTFTDGSINVAMTSMFVPDPVISLSIKAADTKSETNMSKALRRFSREDPTFRVHGDEESGETIISGMGELHLDVYIERMKREYGALVVTSPPQVAYRETFTQRAEFNYTHKKQTGGSGQFGKVGGYLEPYPDGDFEFVDEIRGGSIPREFISSCEKGFKSMLAKGRKIGFPVVNVRVVLNDGGAHAVDSSDIAFQEAARGAWRETYEKAKPIILEPIMKVAVEGPSDFSGNVLDDAHAAPWHDHRVAGRRGLRPHRGRGPARRDVRLRDAAALGHAGQGRVLDGVLALHAGPGLDRRGAHREAQRGEQEVGQGE